jgi:uncharacterized protein (TIGR03382 family)
MKKLILTAALATATAVSGFSQGQVNFQNAGANSSLYFYSTTGTKVTSGSLASQAASLSTSTGVVDIGLYWSTQAFTDAAQGTLADLVTMSTTTAGAIGGGNVVLPEPSGAQVYVQVFAWDSTYATPDAALAANGLFAAWSAGAANTTYGAIGAAQLTSGLTASPAPGAPIFGTGAGQFGKAVLLSSPEPATIALGGLGAAALLLFRRRK